MPCRKRLHCCPAAVVAAVAAAAVAAVAAATVAAMKTMAATAVVWVVACLCCIVRLACRGAPENWITTAKWGSLDRSFQDGPTYHI
jgi:hypothetical protein